MAELNSLEELGEATGTVAADVQDEQHDVRKEVVRKACCRQSPTVRHLGDLLVARTL